MATKQLNRNDLNNESQQNDEFAALIGITKALGRAHDKMTMPEKKLCLLAMSKLCFKNADNNREVWLDKKEIQLALKTNIGYENQSQYLRRLAHSMINHSFMVFQGKDRDDYADIGLFDNVIISRSSGKMMLCFSERGMEHLQSLKNGSYMILFLNDVLQMSSDENGQRTLALYESLLLQPSGGGTAFFSTKQLKELWGMPKSGSGSYTTSDGHFDRWNFEHYVLTPVLNQLFRCRRVILKPYENALFKKVKEHGRIIGYRISYEINRYEAMKESATIKRISADHQSKEMYAGRQPQERHTKPNPYKKKLTGWASAEQHQYDFDALEKMLLV